MSLVRLSLGCHLSSAGGYVAMGRRALALGATTFAFFTRNPRGGSARPHDEADAVSLAAMLDEHGFGPLVAHAPYTLNLCSAKPEVRQFARTALAEDLAEIGSLGGRALYNLHPGSHVGQGADVGCELVAEALASTLAAKGPATVLLETMAGKGTEVGRSFEELARIIELAGSPERLGVCLDTCHVHDAGYDIAGDLDGVLAEFDRVIGLGRLKALHLNDSKNPLGSHKDRHERLGLGELGLATFARIVRHPVLSSLPMVLETPNEPRGYAAEIAALRSLADGADVRDVLAELVREWDGGS